MATNTEVYLIRTNKKEASEILKFIFSLDDSNLHDFYRFTQGVNCGLTLGGRATRRLNENRGTS